jgi:hypothetical protein
MILKPALAAMIASGLLVPEAPKLVFPKPAIVKAEHLELSRNVLLGMPLTMGMLAGKVSDPFYSSVSLLHRYNGTNASTTMTDEGPLAITSTANGNAQLTTTSPKFGTACLTLDGTGDWVATATHASGFSFGTGDFTVELWVKSSQTSRADIICQTGAFNGGGGWWGLIANVFSSGNVEWYEGGTSRINGTSTGWNNGSWHHIAVTRSGTSVKMFVDGTQVGSTYTTSYTYGEATKGISIGIQNGGTGPLNGQLDNVRITKGVARYTANFTAPGDFPAS